MTKAVQNFLKAEDGGSVIDMTMLMAALAGLAMAVTTQVSGGLETLTTELETVVSAQDAEAAW